jgi:hypothetical protein
VYLFKRHYLPIEAHLRHSFVLAYSVHESALKSLVSPGLELDTFKGHGFLVVAMVQTEGLRVRGAPSWIGLNFFLAGYRLFVRYMNPERRRLRGLQVLASETDSLALCVGGNLLTHYKYQRVNPDVTVTQTHVRVKLARGGQIGLDFEGDLSQSELPEESIFSTAKEARAFAGPMPFTFDFEPQTRSIISVQGVRSGWTPKLFKAKVVTPPDFSKFGVELQECRLASAFHLSDVPYSWNRGKVEKLP